MTASEVEQFRQLMNQIAAAHTTAALCTEEVRALLRTTGTRGDTATPGVHVVGADEPEPGHLRPEFDLTTQAVRWRNRTCVLRSEIQFRLLQCLARRPGRLVGYERILEDAWLGDRRTAATIRSTVRHLKRQLEREKMRDLAQAVVGHDRCYSLMV